MSLSKTSCQKVWAEDWWSAAGHTGFSLHPAKNLYIYVNEKNIPRIGFPSLADSQADSCCKLSGSAGADCTEHTLLLTGLVSSACSVQPTHRNWFASAGGGRFHLAIFTHRNAMQEFISPSSHTHTRTHTFVSGGSSWPSSLTSKAGWMKPEGGRELLLLIICYLCSVYLGVALGIFS